MSKKLYVGNLSFKTTESELRSAFSQYGDVDSVSIVVDRETGRCRGFGFVEMTNPEEAKLCIAELDNKEFMGRNLKVNIAENKKTAYRNNY